MKCGDREVDEPPYFHHRMELDEIAEHRYPFWTDFGTVREATNREDLDNSRAISIPKRHPMKRRRETPCLAERGYKSPAE